MTVRGLAPGPGHFCSVRLRLQEVDVSEEAWRSVRVGLGLGPGAFHARLLAPRGWALPKRWAGPMAAAAQRSRALQAVDRGVQPRPSPLACGERPLL